jgi:AcrR family transcriptional regulator
MNQAASLPGEAMLNIEQRRTPVQDRSRERVELILNESANLIMEVGVQGVKTSEIARRANISLASLYRYFPNKSAIVKALAERHMEKLSKVLKEFASGLDIEQGFDQLIDNYALFYRSEPGYKEIWSGVEAMPELQELDMGELFDNAHIIAENAGKVFPAVDKNRIWLICVMLTRICGNTMRLAMTMEPEQEQIMLSELKMMIRLYLKNRIGQLQH